MTEEENDGKKDENEPAESFPTRAFDVIVLGTGLAESLIASSASKNGKKSVLLLDANDHYGNSFGTLTEARGTAHRPPQWTPNTLIKTKLDQT